MNGRDRIEDVRIVDHLRIGRAGRGNTAGMRRRPLFGPRTFPASPEADEASVGEAHLMPRDGQGPGDSDAVVELFQELVPGARIPWRAMLTRRG
jgi:hypothetical protein